MKILFNIAGGLVMVALFVALLGVIAIHPLVIALAGFVGASSIVFYLGYTFVRDVLLPRQ